jgi:hypothetical protein
MNVRFYKGLSDLDAHIRRRLRMYLWRQWSTGRKRFRELRRRGTAKFQAAVAAGSPTGFWRMSSHPPLDDILNVVVEEKKVHRYLPFKILLAPT